MFAIGLAIMALGMPAHRCHWHLTVTGGQKPGSAIVLHLTNSCDKPGGPQITKPIGWIGG